MIRKAFLIALRFVSFHVGYGLRMGWAEADAKLSPMHLPRLK